MLVAAFFRQLQQLTNSQIRPQAGCSMPRARAPPPAPAQERYVPGLVEFIQSIKSRMEELEFIRIDEALDVIHNMLTGLWVSAIAQSLCEEQDVICRLTPMRFQQTLSQPCGHRCQLFAPRVHSLTCSSQPAC